MANRSLWIREGEGCEGEGILKDYDSLLFISTLTDILPAKEESNY
jgi:hypothetical protein